MILKSPLLYIKILCGICSIFFLFSCKNDSVKNYNIKQFNNKCKLKYTGKKSFILNDSTSVMVEYMQYIDRANENTLTFVNTYDNSIYYYNYETTSFNRKIAYEKEGNNGVGKIMGYYILNNDSIFTYESGSARVCLTNDKANVLWRKRIYNPTKQSMSNISPSPYLQTNTPIKISMDYLIMNGFVSGETTLETSSNRPVSILYNLKTEEIIYANNYPEQYQKYNWGGSFCYRLTYFDIDDNGNMLVSFPADHGIYIHSLKDHLKSYHYAGSELIDEIKPYPKTKEDNTPLNDDNVFSWYMSTNSYEGVLYDKYRHLYYRIARLPDKSYTSNKMGNHKPIIIIVLDAKYNYQGEVKLPDDVDYKIGNSFVSKDGINIQVLTDNEDELCFYQYKIDLDEK